MNAEQLFRYYERIADAPNAIARLRRFILDLAVRGKLVPQDPKDEPASELLKRIAKQKATLVNAGEIRKEKPLPPVGEDADFNVPPAWRWTRLGIVTSYIQRGKSPKYAALDGSLVVSQKCVQWRGLDLSVAKRITLESLTDYEGIRFLRDGDLLWNSTGTGTIGRVIRLTEPPENLVCDSHVTIIRCLEVDPEYIRTWLRSDHVYGVIEDRAAGSTNQVELTAQMAVNQVLPLPPLAEQHRIVAKVNGLMALCNRLETARAEREARRDRLTAASLARLNAPDPETFQADARFTLNTLPALTTRPDQIKTLRQTILNLAVRGKLVPQNPNDEPASELLKRIATEKARLDRRERIKREPRSLNGDAEPVQLPRGWALAPLADLVTVLNGRAYRQNELLSAGTPVLRVGNLFTSDRWYYSTLQLEEDKYCDKGDLIFSWSASFGPFIWSGEKVIYHYHIWKLSLHSEADLNKLYLYNFLLQKTRQIKEAGHGISMIHMTKEKMELIQVPLPPLAEQHRIVAKVNELMALCDRLEASLATADNTRRRLLEALLAEALTPNHSEREAA